MGDPGRTGENTEFRYRGAQVAVALHEEQLRRFVEVWKRAKAVGLILPEVDDPDYASLDALMRHVLRWARTYLVWMCEQLELPATGIEPLPTLATIESEVEAYVEHLVTAWRTPLSDTPQERFFDRLYLSPWQVRYCIDAMLEHAVMHPLRHGHQLEQLMRR